MPNARKRVIGEGKILSKVAIFEDLVFVSGIGPHDPKTGNKLREEYKSRPKRPWTR